MSDSTPVFETGTNNFLGHDPRRCGEHRTAGGRAWCFDDGEWCSPSTPCHGCMLAHEFVCRGCETYLGTLNSMPPTTSVVVVFKCPDCGLVNSWGTPSELTI